MSKDAIGNNGCKELGLSQKECVERKIKIFCGLIEENGGDKNMCVELFDEYRNGKISTDELALKLREQFGQDILMKAREKLKERLHESH